MRAGGNAVTGLTDEAVQICRTTGGAMSGLPLGGPSHGLGTRPLV
jgi:hypothetical protein